MNRSYDQFNGTVPTILCPDVAVNQTRLMDGTSTADPSCLDQIKAINHLKRNDKSKDINPYMALMSYI